MRKLLLAIPLIVCSLLILPLAQAAEEERDDKALKEVQEVVNKVQARYQKTRDLQADCTQSTKIEVVRSNLFMSLTFPAPFCGRLSSGQCSLGGTGTPAALNASCAVRFAKCDQRAVRCDEWFALLAGSDGGKSLAQFSKNYDRVLKQQPTCSCSDGDHNR